MVSDAPSKMQRPPGPQRWLLAATLALAAPGWAAADPAAATAAIAVPTVTVGSTARGAGFEVDGTLQPLQQSTVGAQVAGNVLRLAVKAGDRVRAGQPLARIDGRATQTALAGAEAGVAQAEAAQRHAASQLQRTRELRTQGFVSQVALDVAQTQLQAADAALQQARAAQAQAALARGFATVTAPFDAVVLATHVEVGDLAAPGRALLTLYAPGRLRAVVHLAASRSAAARGAAATELQLPGGRWVAPIARTELPGTDAVSQTVEWRLDLSPAHSAGLMPGQNVRVRFAGAPGTADATPAPGRVVVPAAAVLRRGELSAVYAAQDGRFVLKAVRLGAAVGDGIEVLAGLKTGERIAADPVRAGLAGAVPAPQ